MLIPARHDGVCAACGDMIFTGTPMTVQAGPPGSPPRTSHRACPYTEPEGSVPIGLASWDAIDRVELRSLADETPVPYLLTQKGRAALTWR